MVQKNADQLIGAAPPALNNGPAEPLPQTGNLSRGMISLDISFTDFTRSWLLRQNAARMRRPINHKLSREGTSGVSTMYYTLGTICGSGTDSQRSEGLVRELSLGDQSSGARRGRAPDRTIHPCF